jgi:hypothetical protein
VNQGVEFRPLMAGRLFLPERARETGRWLGSEKRVACDYYVIRTGFSFEDERTGKRFAVLTCSLDQERRLLARGGGGRQKPEPSDVLARRSGEDAQSDLVP